MSAGAAKEILITGASSGIGLELARQLAGPGKRLWLVARSGDQLQSLADEIRAKGGAAEVKLVLEVWETGLEEMRVMLREGGVPSDAITVTPARMYEAL